MLARKALAGTAGTPKLYVEDVFSTYLYTGNGSTQTITNNIDLSGEGGLVWIKERGAVFNHILTDTARGVSKFLYSDQTNAQETYTSYGVTSFNNNGFAVADTTVYGVNKNTSTYASWTFRKAEKFFDVVTYTGNGSNRTISHSLGSTPGCIIVKRTDTTGDWYVYHRSNTANPETDYLLLNSTAATADLDTVWNDTAPTSTVFSVGTNSGVNANTGTYVAYLFAHDAGGFGDAGSDNVISCGSYSGTGSTTGFDVTLGYEPQWVLVKRSSGGTGNWTIVDNMRGFAVTAPNKGLTPNTSDAEYNLSSTYPIIQPTATGFRIQDTTNADWNASSSTYIYIAIRRGPMKTPETGTSVFAPSIANGATQPGFVTDLQLANIRSGDTYNTQTVDRLRGGTLGLVTSSTAVEYTGSNQGFDTNNGTTYASWTSGDVRYSFRRAPGFFDVVCYTGNGVNSRTITHNLGVVPELIIFKRRNNTENWPVYSAAIGSSEMIDLDRTNAKFGVSFGGTPTSSVFYTETTADTRTNASGSTYVAYLFASLSGVSKIGTYTGNGSSVTVTTNFQPRFILVKRTDSTGNWIVGDSARGLPTGNDPALFLNSTAAETTGQDWVDVSSTGFTVNETALNANVNTGTYLYLAIS